MEVIVQYNDNGSAVTYGKIACELIRCKNCDYWNRFTEDFFGERDAGCGVHDEQFFCSDGRRRSE